jgi:hypothetical protein
MRDLDDPYQYAAIAAAITKERNLANDLKATVLFGGDAGRPPGSRNRLSESFIQAVYEDFRLNGTAAIERVRNERPADYLKIIVAIIPKEVHVTERALEDISDEELMEMMDTLRSLGSAAGKMPRKADRRH